VSREGSERGVACGSDVDRSATVPDGARPGVGSLHRRLNWLKHVVRFLQVGHLKWRATEPLLSELAHRCDRALPVNDDNRHTKALQERAAAIGDVAIHDDAETVTFAAVEKLVLEQLCERSTALVDFVGF
jgi:hypothetical protein